MVGLHHGILHSHKGEPENSVCTDNIHRARAEVKKVKAEMGLEYATIGVKILKRRERMHIHISLYGHKLSLERCTNTNTGFLQEGGTRRKASYCIPFCNY